MTVSNILPIDILKGHFAIINEPNKAYKALSKFEKLDLIKDYSPKGKRDRHLAAGYLKALWINDVETINDFEQFGDGIHKIILNKVNYQLNCLFGYFGIEFTEYGWLIRPELLDKETITINPHSDNVLSMNYIQIGRAVSGHWLFAINYSTGVGGAGSGLDLWCDPLPTKAEAIKAGLEEIIYEHKRAKESFLKHGDSCGNFNLKFSDHIVSLCKEKIKEFKHGKIVQLQMF